jgi:hypothetical protein
MAQFTKMKTPFDDDTESFSDQLSRASRVLDLAPPTFRGRVIPCEILEINRWEIETKIKGRTIEPPTEIVVYSRMYPDWETGIMMAMEETLARICGMYPKEIFDRQLFSTIWETQPRRMGIEYPRTPRGITMD